MADISSPPGSKVFDSVVRRKTFLMAQEVGDYTTTKARTMAKIVFAPGAEVHYARFNFPELRG